MLLLKHTHVSNAFGSLRTVCADNEVFFCANDVAKTLGFKDPHSAVRTHCLMPIKFTHSVSSNPNRVQKMNFIDPDDVLRLAKGSPLDEAYKETFLSVLFLQLMPEILDEYKAGPDPSFFKEAAHAPEAQKREKSKAPPLDVMADLMDTLKERFGDDVVLDAIIFPN